MIKKYNKYINEHLKPSDDFIKRKLVDNNRNFEDDEIVVCIRQSLPYYIFGHKYIVCYHPNQFIVKDIVNNERSFGARKGDFISEFEYEHGEDQESYNI